MISDQGSWPQRVGNSTTSHSWAMSAASPQVLALAVGFNSTCWAATFPGLLCSPSVHCLTIASAHLMASETRVRRLPATEYLALASFCAILRLSLLDAECGPSAAVELLAIDMIDGTP
jgi:hypothetical protein